MSCPSSCNCAKDLATVVPVAHSTVPDVLWTVRLPSVPMVATAPGCPAVLLDHRACPDFREYSTRLPSVCMARRTLLETMLLPEARVAPEARILLAVACLISVVLPVAS